MSNRNKLLIGTEELRENTMIQGGVQDSTLRPIIRLAQDTNFQELVGESFYNFMLSARTQNESYSGLTNTQQIFIDDFFKPYMFNACVYEFLYSNSVNLSEIGITQTVSTESNLATDSEIKAQRSKAQNNMNFYANRMMSFICLDTNYQDFQQYISSDKQTIYANDRAKNKGGVWYPKSCDERYNWSNYKRYDI
jgi:hypothetical protein